MNRKYRWSDGKNQLPKCWYAIINHGELSAEKEWLNDHIYARPGAADSLTIIEIRAHKRYSFRAQQK